MDAEKDKMRSELEHHRKSQVYQELESKVHKLEKSHKRSIVNARPYYELKSQLETQLQVASCLAPTIFMSRSIVLAAAAVCLWAFHKRYCMAPM